MSGNQAGSRHSPPSPPVSNLATIEIAKEYLNFSAGHFTLFSATDRENLHGHNWRVGCEVSTPVGGAGLCFDYAIIKRRLQALCDSLDEKVLLPGSSPWLRVEQGSPWVIAHYANEQIPFLPRDVLILDGVRNVTVEELAGWLLERLLKDPEISEQEIHRLKLRVSSGTNQWAAREWSIA